MSRLARNILYNLGGQFAMLVLGLVSAKYIFGDLGADVLGIIYFALMINTFAVSILQLGITATTIREIAANEADPEYVGKIIRSGAFFYWIAYVVVGAALLLLTPWFVRNWITLKTLGADDAISMLRILGAFTLLSVPQTFYVSVFRGVQRMAIPNLIDVGTTVVQQAGVIVIITVSGDVYLVVWWIALSYVIRVLMSMMILGRVFGWTVLVPKLDRGVVERTRSFTLQMTAISLLSVVHTQTDKFVIASLLPVAAIGVYGLLYSTIARGSILTSAVAQSAFPALAELVATNDRQNLIAKYQRLQDLLCYGLVPLYALLAFATYPLFTIILDSQTASVVVVPGLLLAVGYYMNGALNVPYYLALAANRPEIVTRLNVLALFATLPITVALTWRFGFTGAAASWVWYHLFAFTYVVPRICKHCIGIAPVVWFVHLGRVLALAAATYGTAAVVAFAVLAPTIVALATAYIVASIVFATASWFMIAPGSRAGLAELLGSLKGARSSRRAG